MELFLIILIIGIVLYQILRHPLRTTKFIWNTLGIIVLGVLGFIGFFFMIYGIIHFI